MISQVFSQSFTMKRLRKKSDYQGTGDDKLRTNGTGLSGSSRLSEKRRSGQGGKRKASEEEVGVVGGRSRMF